MLLASLPASLLLAALAGWLATVDARPLRLWARYPWRAFWGAYVFSLAFHPPLNADAIRAGLVLSALPLVVMYLSAVQGLRVSWRRSPVVGVLVLAGAFAVGVVGAIMRLLRTGEWQRLDVMVLVCFLVVAYWALVAHVADRVARHVGGEVEAAPQP